MFFFSVCKSSNPFLPPFLSLWMQTYCDFKYTHSSGGKSGVDLRGRRPCLYWIESIRIFWSCQRVSATFGSWLIDYSFNIGTQNVHVFIFISSFNLLSLFCYFIEINKINSKINRSIDNGLNQFDRLSSVLVDPGCLSLSVFSSLFTFSCAGSHSLCVCVWCFGAKVWRPNALSVCLPACLSLSECARLSLPQFILCRRPRCCRLFQMQF